jgi:uncharacterized protein
MFFIIWFVLPNYLKAQELKQKDSVTTVADFQFPTSIGWVNDFENILSSGQENKLSRTIKKFEWKTSNEICIVTIDSIRPYDNFADYTTDLANFWGIGKKDKNNGLLIVFSMKLREMRIGTGFGVENILTDKICKHIIDNMMVPEFKKVKYFKGLKKGVNELIKKWEE